MRESPRLSRPPVNRHPHINHVFDLSEQIVQITIAHVEGHVPYEQRFGRRIGWSIVRVRLAWRAVADARVARERVLDRETAAFEVFHVVEFNGAAGGFGGFESDVAESVSSGDDQQLPSGCVRLHV